MADSLVLTGVRDVKKHTGDEMLLLRPKKGGDTFHLKEWWRGGKGKIYTDCSVFKVTTANGVVKLAIDSNMGTNLRIDHDGDFNFKFYGANEVKRAALFTENFELIEHYMFPTIAGGPIVTVTPAGAASRPNVTPPPAPSPEIGNAFIGGDSTPEVNVSETYSINVPGTATQLTYAWSITGIGALNNATDQETVLADFNSTVGTGTITCVVTASDDGVTDSPKTVTLDLVSEVGP
jgi:hypothetical protein